MAYGKFYKKEKEKQVKLLRETPLFNGDKGEGLFNKKSYSHILEDGRNNLYYPIRDEAILYFKENGIAWWNGAEPTGNLLSSQIACLNHLFPLRNQEEILLEILNHAQETVHFTKLLPIPGDKLGSLIAFEMTSKIDHLNEGIPTRGSNCTSIDAFIYAEDSQRKRWLIPIEWKYTESYSLGKSADKSIEDREGYPKGNREKGYERQRRYNNLINGSKQLNNLENYEGSIYYFEPFYQLMRQTLWAEQMIANKSAEDIEADDFLHIHVVPLENTDLLQNKYPGKKTMEETWREMIKDQSKYILIDPQKFLKPIQKQFLNLWDYLNKRYNT